MRGNRLQVLGYSLIFFFLSTVNCTLYPIFAADSTPSADIKIKLEELKKEIASKAAKLKQEINRQLKDKAYVGEIKSKSASSITLITKNGPKIVNINQDTEFESNIKGKKYSQKLLTEQDFLAALGDVDETGVLTAKKIVLLPTPNSEIKTYLWGQITAISDKLITLKGKNLKNTAVSINNPSNINIPNFVIFTGSFGKNEIFQADFAYVIPQGGVLKPARPAGGSKKSATASAKIATPSATPKPSKPTSR